MTYVRLLSDFGSIQVNEATILIFQSYIPYTSEKSDRITKHSSVKYYRM